LVDNVASAANIVYYAKIVKEKAVRRAILGAAARMIDAAYSPEKSTEDATSEAQQIVLSPSMTGGKRRIQALCEITKHTCAMIEERSKRGGALPGLSMGLGKLDELTLGLHPGELFIIAARPGMGKTSFCLNVAQYVATVGQKPVAIFSLEMSGQQLVLRLLCAEARINSAKVRKGFLDKDDWPRLTKAAGIISEAPIYIDDSAALSTLDIRARARRLKAEKGLELVMIDYLQLITGRSKYESRHLEISEITRSLKALAKELGVPVVAVSQLSRAVEHRSDRKPQLSDLRESGSIEQDGDLIVLLYRDEVYNKDSPDGGTAEVNIAKQRNGPTGEIKLTFLKEYTKFENYSPLY